MPSLTAEQIIENFIGVPASNLKLSCINVNSDCRYGVTENQPQIKCIDFLQACEKFIPSLRKELKDELKEYDKKNITEIANTFLVPFWFSPSSNVHKKNPVDFGGNHVAEELLYKTGSYATHQVMPINSSTNMCVFLASKRMYQSLPGKDPVLLVNPDGFTAKDVEYCIDRGVCNTVDIKTNESCRYIIKYDYDSKKTGMIFICGNDSFLAGSSEIFKEIFTNVEIIKARQRNKKRNGIDLNDIHISDCTASEEKQKEILDACSIKIARLLGGSVVLHDVLCLMRDIYGVKKLISFDHSREEDREMSSVSIQSVIDDYFRIKQYYYLNKALKFIQ